MSKSATDDKKLEALRRQLFGKTISANKTPKVSSSESTHTFQNAQTPTSNTTSETDLSYLKKDIIKMLVLSTVALLIQFSLYTAINNHLIKLPF